MLLGSSVGLEFNPVIRSILIIQLAFYAVAVAGWVLTTIGRKETGILALPFYYVLVNAAALAGLIEACLGRRYTVWEVATLTRGTDVRRQQ